MSILSQLQRHCTSHGLKIALCLGLTGIGCSGETGILSGSNNSDTGLSVIPSGTEYTASVTTTSTEKQTALYFTIEGNLHVFDGGLVPDLSELTISLYDDSVWRCSTAFTIEEVLTVDPAPDKHLLGWWLVSSLATINEYCAVPAASLFLGIGGLPASIEPQIIAEGLGQNALQGLFLGRTEQELWAIGTALPPDSGGIMGVLQDGKYALTTLYLIPW